MSWEQWQCFETRQVGQIFLPTILPQPPSPASEVSEQDAEAAAENVGFVDLIKDGVARLSDFLKMKDGGWFTLSSLLNNL